MNWNQWRSDAYRKCQLDIIETLPMDTTDKEAPTQNASGAHGGTRRGAGRPAKAPEDKFKVMSLTLEQRQLGLLKEWAKDDKTTVSALIRTWIDDETLARSQ